MKKFICDLLHTIAVLCGFFGAILVMNGAIEYPYAFAIAFSGLFLFLLVPFVEDAKPEEKHEDTKERES